MDCRLLLKKSFARRISSLHWGHWRGVLIVMMCLLGCVALSADADPDSSNDPAAVLGYLDHAIDWYRRIVVLNQTPVDPRELILRDQLVEASQQVLARAFIFAKADAALIGSTQTAPATTNAAAVALNKSASAKLIQVNQQIVDLQTQLSAFQNQIAADPSAADGRVLAQRDKLASLLNLLQAKQQVLVNYTAFMSQAGGEDLVSKINDLQQSVPEISDVIGQLQVQMQQNPAADQTASSAAPAPTDQPSDDSNSTAASKNGAPALSAPSDGIFGLVEDFVTLVGRRATLQQIDAATTGLQTETEKLHLPLRDELIDSIHQGDLLATSRPTDDIASLAHDKSKLDVLTQRFKYLSAAAVPLGEQNVQLSAMLTNLGSWRTTVEEEYVHVLQSLGIHIGLVGIVILILIGLSELWRRATFRYIGDIRRRRQFLVLRRFVVGSAIMLAILASFVTELSSLATFAGIITAGIAVALQSIILSGVAYFFIIGRYGVRVGDRVTISGVTGDVMDIGLFRLYLMEIGGPALDLHPTGRIVVFSNAVLFQPSAFFKNIPGAEYVWHEIAMTLSPNADFTMVHDRLMLAINEVYATYSDAVQRQYDSVKDTIHLSMPAPKPHGRLRFVDSGVEFAVRYPVETERENEIDSKMTQAMLKMIEKEPNLHMVATSTPKLQPADDRK